MLVIFFFDLSKKLLYMLDLQYYTFFLNTNYHESTLNIHRLIVSSPHRFWESPERMHICSLLSYKGFLSPIIWFFPIFILGAPARLWRHLRPADVETMCTSSLPTNPVTSSCRAVGLSAQMSGWNRPQHLSVSPPSPPFRGAGGYKPPAITAPIPGARPSHHFRVSRRTSRHPRPHPFPRREPPHPDHPPMMESAPHTQLQTCNR